MRIEALAFRYAKLCEVAQKAKQGWTVSCNYEEIEGYDHIIFNLREPMKVEDTISASQAQKLVAEAHVAEQERIQSEWELRKWRALMVEIAQAAKRQEFEINVETVPSFIFERLCDLGYHCDNRNSLSHRAYRTYISWNRNRSLSW